MREDNRDRFVEELLDAALASHHSAEPRAGLEERVLANLRQQPRMARAVLWNSAPVMIAVVAMFSLFAVDHLVNHQAASDPAVAVSNVSRVVEPNPAARLTKEPVVNLSAKRVKAATKPAPSSLRHDDLAANLDSPRADEQASDGLRIEEVRIADVRLDDIVISNNERNE
ncbi:MAG: hypothetical protein AB7U82_09635 [Blastocatellales bacterium]